jgi:pimeloyl-ACP methyl ester carboxylesterase
MARIDGAGVELEYTEAGPADGPAAVLVHGIASDARQHAATQAALAAAGRRAIAYDRRGYGASGAPEPYNATTVVEQTHDLEALLSGLDAAPALLVGDGFGALVALALAQRVPALVRGVAAADPPLFALVPEANEALSEQRRLLQEALVDGGPRAAVAQWLGGRVDDDALGRAQAAATGFFADYAGLASWEFTRRELRAMTVPVAVVTGASSAPPIVLAADRLAELLPAAWRVTDGDAVAAALGLGA